MFFETGPSLISGSGLQGAPPPLSEGLDPPLYKHSWVQIKLLLLNCCCCYKHSTLTDITHMDDSLFFIFPPIFENVFKWGSGSFEFYLLVRVISSRMPFDPGPFNGSISEYGITLYPARPHQKII